MPRAKKSEADPRLPEDRPVYCAAASALLYVTIATLYILVSGRVAAALAKSVEQLQQIEAAKGLVFVAVTGLLFFFISLGWWRTRRTQRDLIIQSERRAVAAMYTATLAHDLNNLLLALSGLVDAIKAHEKEDAYLSTLRASVEHWLHNLAPFAKRIASSAKQLPLGEKAVVDLPAALTQIVELARKHPDVKWCTLIADELAPVSLTLEQSLLEQAVLNLLLNAAQAAGPHGTVKLALTRLNHSVAIDVHDSGPGIPPEKVETVFNPGYTTKANGSGLGLLTVQAFAASCRARVRVERSPLLGGALFRVVIPLEQEPPKPAA